MTNGYDFYFKTSDGLMIFPITPPSLKIKIGSNNEVVNLINEGDINILKSPSLTEIEFEARFPMRKYPYSRTPQTFDYYYDLFSKLKEEKKSFRFIVARNNPKLNRVMDTNILVALEDFTVTEDANEGDDVLIAFNLKQYKEYGVAATPIKVKGSTPTTTSTSNVARPSDKASEQTTHTIKSGDTLWSIAKKHYGNGALYTKIYNANKSAIEADAKKHGKQSSKEGHWIWPDLTLVIPAK